MNKTSRHIQVLDGIDAPAVSLSRAGAGPYTDGMDVRLVVVHSCGNEAEAELAKGALESAGIEVMIQADDVGGMRPHVAWASNGYKLLVREEDAAAAREVLENPEPADSDTV